MDYKPSIWKYGDPITERELNAIEKRAKNLEYALLGMVLQYCTEDMSRYGGKGEALCHSWMEAGETAFAVLGIDESTPVDVVRARADMLEQEIAAIEKGE